MRCPPPEWFIPTLNEVLERSPDDRAEGLRELWHLVLEYLAEYREKVHPARPQRNGGQRM
ncbi:MAG: hypothetical protein ACRD4Q_15445 [Candidatus Acidiferrales bacterium]